MWQSDIPFGPYAHSRHADAQSTEYTVSNGEPASETSSHVQQLPLPVPGDRRAPPHHLIISTQRMDSGTQTPGRNAQRYQQAER